MDIRQKLFLILALIAGYLVAQQFLVSKQAKQVISANEDNNAIALEISSLMENNKDLRRQLDALQNQISELKEITDDRKNNSESLKDNLVQNKIIAGRTKVAGEGLKIEFTEPLVKTQLIDFVNALRNIGAEAISVNSHRFTQTSSFDNINLVPPYVIEVIGKKEILSEALTRKGGILEQIGRENKVEKKEQLILDAK